MRVVKLAPIVHKDKYSAGIAKEIAAYFQETITDPLEQILKSAGVGVRRKGDAPSTLGMGVTVHNARRSPGEIVQDALADGHIHWADGKIVSANGRFSATLSKAIKDLGGRFVHMGNYFSLSIAKVPMALRTYVAESLAVSVAAHKGILEFLQTAQMVIQSAPNVPTGISFSSSIDSIANDLQKQFEASLIPVEAVVEVPADITPAARKVISDEFTQSLELPIKNFAAERLVELRRRVEENATAGFRPDRLAKIIEAEFGIERRRANFLAEQETSLFLGKFRAGRYKGVGVTLYQWSTSHDERVRADHRLLDGKEFSFDHPPVSNWRTGARNNPGEDYGCRCVPIPIIRLPDPDAGPN